MMKKKLLFILFIVISINNFSQQVLGFPEISEVDSWDGNSWVNAFKSTYTFNSDCFPIEILGQFYNEGTLENSSLVTIIYNSSDQPAVQWIYQIWDSGTATWINTQKTEFTEDGEKIIQTTDYYWVSGSWQLFSRSVFSYNSSGLSTDITNQNWDNSNGIWVNLSRTEILHDSENREEISTSFNWNTIAMIWEKDSKQTIIYINSTDLYSSVTTDTWNIDQWVNNSLATYTYDANNYLIEYLSTDWDATSMNYLNYVRMLYTNNSEGYPTTIMGQLWDSSTSSWLNLSRDRRTYPDCLSLTVLDFEKVEFKVFPNPAIEKVFVNSTVKTTYILSNINGQLLKKGTLIQGVNIINVSHLPNGLYFINIKMDNGNVIKKIIRGQ